LPTHVVRNAKFVPPFYYPVVRSLLRVPLRATLFPYTTLFRSCLAPLTRHRSQTGKWPEFHTLYYCRTATRHDPPASIILPPRVRSEEHTSELQSRENLVCRLLLEKKNKNTNTKTDHCCESALE